jgi:LysM repeat protein
MKKLTPFLLIVFLLTGPHGFAQSSTIIKEYVEKFKDIAIEEMIRTGVPASITLAQGIHETEAGRSALVRKSNNHFGIKCKKEWTGESVSHDDDARGECFRKYNDPVDSYRDHSDFLKNRAHYSSLFQLDPTDYEGWAYGLKKAGYATNPKYPQLLIKLIRDYNLQEYTMMALGRKSPFGPTETEGLAGIPPVSAIGKETIKETATTARKPAYPTGIFQINETNVVFVAKGTSFLLLAQEHHIPLNRLFDFNDMTQQEEAEKDKLIFLQRKRKTGTNEFHTVAEGETLHDIAQAEGIRLESLLTYNLLKEGMQPQIGETLHLRGKGLVMPRLFTKRAAPSVPASKETTPVSFEGSYEMYTLHTVQPKETLYAISRKYAVMVDDILVWNNLQTSELKTGQQLRINKKSNATTQAAR